MYGLSTRMENLKLMLPVLAGWRRILQLAVKSALGGMKLLWGPWQETVSKATDPTNQSLRSGRVRLDTGMRLRSTPE